MAKKSTIRSSLFQPTEPAPSRRATPPVVKPTKPTVEEPRHHTSTRVPMDIHEYFEELAVENGYSAHSLRIFAMAWFVKEHKAGNIELRRDRSVKGRRVLAMPDRS